MGGPGGPGGARRWQKSTKSGLFTISTRNTEVNIAESTVTLSSPFWIRVLGGARGNAKDFV